MKQKTAMMELIDWVMNDLKLDGYEHNLISSKAINLLEKEKEQMSEASLYGWRKCLDNNVKTIHPDDYYNETFKQD